MDQQPHPFTPDIWLYARETLGEPGGPLWNWSHQEYPYWRIYWNARQGAWVEHAGQVYPVDPEVVVVVSPNAVTNLRQDRVVDHTYVHATLGYPYDSVTPQVFSVPADRVAVDLLSEVLPVLPPRFGKAVLSPQQTLAMHAFVTGVLARLPASVWPSPSRDSTLNRLLRDIDNDPGKRWRIPEMAQRCGVSLATLSRRFREQVGTSPQRYVTECRLQQACLLLHHTTQSLEQIATVCGFCDRYAFSKTFSRYRGVGPATFRRGR